jgi:hypothetical protein
MIEEYNEYKFIYYPWDREFPIKRCELIIFAKDRKEAELLALNNNWKFFDQDQHVKVEEGLVDYRQVVEQQKENGNAS